MSLKTFLSKLFAFKFLWLTDLFTAMEKGWNHLTDEEKLISSKASGWIAIINANLTQVPDVVYKLIQAKFPDVTPETVAAELQKAGVILGIADKEASLSFTDAIAAFQTWLGKQTGKAWETISIAAVHALLTVMLPTTTPLEKISTILQFIYDEIVKPLLTH